MAEVNIWENDTRVGKVLFDEHPTYLSYARTADGFNVRIPAEISLKSSPPDEPLLCLKNVRLTFSLEYAPGSKFELGRLRDDDYHTAYVDKKQSESPRPLDLVWSATLPALLAVETHRAGKLPELHVKFEADLSYIILTEQWQDHVRTQRKRFRVFTVPQRVTENVVLTYPAEVWSEMVRKVLIDSEGDPYLLLLPLVPLLSGDGRR